MQQQPTTPSINASTSNDSSNNKKKSVKFAFDQINKNSSSSTSSSTTTSPSSPLPSTSQQQQSSPSSDMPTIEEVCSTFDLTDVKMDYTENDYQNLITYKVFQQHVRPILQKENPKVPMSKLMMLVAAKWREFSEINPNLQTEEQQSKNDEESPPRSPEYQPKPSRSRSSNKDKVR